MKKVLAILLALALVLSFAACGGKGGDKTDDTKKANDAVSGGTLKVGAILVGDETEGYTLAHMDGINAAAEALRAEGNDVTSNYTRRKRHRVS